MKTVLFVCIGNAARSIIAEAIFNSMAPDGWRAQSAGTMPAGSISESAISVLEEVGVRVEKDKPTVLGEGLAKSADVGITMGCGVEDECPVLFTPVKEDWGIDDPKGAPIEKFREVRGDIKGKVEGLIEEIKRGGIK